MTYPPPSWVDYNDFPNNVVSILAERYKTLPGVLPGSVFRRPLRPTDPNVSIGVVAVDWSPEESEIGQVDPSVSRYVYAIQCFVKHGDETEGLASHAFLSKMVRTYLTRNPETHSAISSLRVETGGHIERTQRFWVNRQQFLSNEIDRTFLYLSVVELWLETETVAI